MTTTSFQMKLLYLPELKKKKPLSLFVILLCTLIRKKKQRKINKATKSPGIKHGFINIISNNGGDLASSPSFIAILEDIQDFLDEEVRFWAFQD